MPAREEIQVAEQIRSGDKIQIAFKVIQKYVKQKYFYRIIAPYRSSCRNSLNNGGKREILIGVLKHLSDV